VFVLLVSFCLRFLHGKEKEHSSTCLLQGLQTT
jgi:hypothetical protein